ncbi:protein draper-like [Saccostrea echinata]|uniref:protein draper-like n=1 Tax=Saccostrea echinata TaxID=191078 RepID=UPI002A841D5A|nr:protein draper-like [Saccostrea echinata]
MHIGYLECLNRKDSNWLIIIKLGQLMHLVSSDGVYQQKKNLALRKQTWQSSSHNATLSGPEKAVDGLKTDLSYNGHQCSVSADKRTNATWWVNLTDILSIHNIVIYYRTDNIAWAPSNQYTSRFMGFYVYISNTTNKQDGHLCFHDRNYTNATIPEVANITCPVHGQYVIYYNERPPKNSYTTGHSQYAFTELCEVEVYGCSTPRRYGTDCSKSCPTNCKEYCDIGSGNCLQCSPGYRGDRCEQACETGFYGADCNQTCGHCKDFKTCNPINGTCSYGCAAGFEGLRCNRECATGFYGDNCTLTCGKCKDSKTCNPINGTCVNGCIAGYGGVLCNKENMAYKKQTWQSSSHDSNVGSEKAVDGLKTDFSNGGHQCSISKDGHKQATWWVNLSEIRSIHESNGYTARFPGFYLYVSNSTNKSNGHLCFHDTNYTRTTIPAVANISCPVHGQYVIYYNERPIKNDNRTDFSTNAFVELCEVEVYGCSSPRRYGSDCSKPCPTNCDKYCDIESGDCLQCRPGYKGLRCEQG